MPASIKVDKEKVLAIVKSVFVPYAPVVNTDYPPGWWDSSFGIRIKQWFCRELYDIVKQIEKLNEEDNAPDQS